MGCRGILGYRTCGRREWISATILYRGGILQQETPYPTHWIRPTRAGETIHVHRVRLLPLQRNHAVCRAQAQGPPKSQICFANSTFSAFTLPKLANQNLAGTNLLPRPNSPQIPCPTSSSPPPIVHLHSIPPSTSTTAPKSPALTARTTA